jgi:flagellar biosynthesis protein
MNKKIKEVVALQYKGEGAPKVTAKGKGDIAKQILALAEQHNIPLYQDEHLSALLSKVDLGDEIPEQLYAAVARIIRFVFELNKEKYQDIHDKLEAAKHRK